LAIRTRAQEEGTAFVIIEGSNGDALAITPQVAIVGPSAGSLPAGQHTKGDLEKMAISRANGQLPPLMFVLDGIKDKPLPWFGLAKKKG
jgi:hypothetical protein